MLEWSTESLPEAERLDAWRDACSRHVYALTPQWDAQAGAFQGRIVRRTWGELDVTDIACHGHRVLRRPQDISEMPTGTCWVYLQRSGSAWFRQRGQFHEAHAGDMVIADGDVPFETGTEGGFDFSLWRMPRARLSPHRPGDGESLTMKRLGAASGERALIAQWLDALLRTGPTLRPGSADAALRSLYALVGAAAGAAPPAEPTRQARRAAALQAIMQEVTRRCTEPGLDADCIAAGFSMSVRKLHLLFETAGETFHEFLTQARLERARAMLRDARWRHAGTAAIGLAAGFSDVSTFYRRFRRHFGVAPGEYRDA
jgi:AraC-like DNA-binding protein